MSKCNKCEKQNKICAILIYCHWFRFATLQPFTIQRTSFWMKHLLLELFSVDIAQDSSRGNCERKLESLRSLKFPSLVLLLKKLRETFRMLSMSRVLKPSTCIRNISALKVLKISKVITKFNQVFSHLSDVNPFWMRKSDKVWRKTKNKENLINFATASANYVCSHLKIIL